MFWVLGQLYISFFALVIFLYYMEIVRIKADIGGKRMMLGMVLSPLLGILFATVSFICGERGISCPFVENVNRYHIFTYLFAIFFFGEDIYKDKYFNGADKQLGKMHTFIVASVIEFLFWVIGYTSAFVLEGLGVKQPGNWDIDIYSFCTLIAFVLCFWINGAIFMRREPNKIVRFLFVLGVETLFITISLLTWEKLMVPFGDFLVSMSIVWAIVDLGKLRRYNPADLNGEERFVTRVNRLYAKKRKFYSVTLCLDVQPMETDDEYIRVFSFYEGALRNMGTIVSDTDSFLYRNTPNSITAVIPTKNTEKDLKRIKDIASKWHNDIYVKQNIKSRILVTLCPDDFEIPSVYINVLKLFSRKELNRNMDSGTTCICDEAFKSKYLGFIAVEKALEQLCEDRNFDVYYQPIYSTEEGYCSCVEALARFPKLDEGFFDRLRATYGEDVCELVKGRSIKDPGNDKLWILKASAEDFIRMAESKKLIYKVGKIVYKKACEFFVTNELSTKYGINYIEINLSLKQCEEENLSTEFMRIANDAGLQPQFINFEITEGIARNRTGIVNRNLKKLQEARFSFSMDDFGTGYSNLIGIVDEKYSVIKIDKSILDNCFDDEDGRKRKVELSEQEREQTTKLLRAVIKMIRGQEKKIVFEGVCDKLRKETLDSFGGGYYQGFYFSEPLREERYMEFLKTIGGKCETADNSKISGAEFKN